MIIGTAPSQLIRFFTMMSPLKEVRYTSRSVTPPRRSRSRSPSRSRARSPSRSRARSRSRSRSQDSEGAQNPGNNLYVTGLSTRITSSDLEKYFGKEGRVSDCHVVLDPRTHESRGFAFVTMETVDAANHCVKYLNRSVLEGRRITVEKAKRKRKRTPTPGKYCGPREKGDSGRRRSRSHSRSPSSRERDSQRRRRERSLSGKA